MKRQLTVEDVADIVAAIENADAEALETSLANPGYSEPDRAELRRYFELRQAVLSVIKGAVPERGHPLGAAEAVAQVAMEIMGFSMRRTHDGDPPCPQCFMQASGNILRYFSRAAGLKAEQIVAADVTTPVRH